jgi:protocatechuate 3,4-dioxygenase beta subunit
VTDEQGQFAFRDLVLGRTEPLRRTIFPLDVIVTAKGHALAWLYLPCPDALPVRFTLPAEASLQGRLVDPQGNAIAGALVQVLQIAHLDQGMRPRFDCPGYVDLQYLQIPMETKTGADGSFRLPGLPRETRATLRFSADRFLLKELYAATTDRPQPNVVVDKDSGAPQPVHTGRFTVRLEPGHRIHGRVVFEDTGQPVRGAGVAFLISPPQQTADSHGAFFLNHLPAGKCHFGVYPPDGTDYLGVQAQVDVPADKWEIEHTVRLPRGARVAGRVVDEEAGTGIAGAPVQYWPVRDQAKSLPYPWTTQTQTDGTFRLAVPSGKGRLVLVGVVPGYLTHDYAGSLSDVDSRWVREIDATRNRPITDVRFTLSRGRVVTGWVLAPDGKPVKAEITSQDHLPSNGYRDLNGSTDAEGKFTLSGLKSKQTYELVFTNRQRKLAAKVVAAPSEDRKPAALEIQLKPMAAVRGRVVDENHHPIPRALARLRRWQGTHGEETGDVVRTDAAGQFTFDTLVPDASYSVEATAEGYSSGRDPSSYSPPFTAQPGRKNALADLQLQRLPAR